MDLLRASFSEIAESVRNNEISAVDVTKFFLNRIESLNPKLNAFTSINNRALEDATNIDRAIQAGKAPGRLAGVPFGIKEMFCTKGIKSTASSKILQNFVPPYDATAVARLKKEGAVILGKLNQDEFAMGSSNETSFFGPTRNPWDVTRVPGGSSGGSASAQATRMIVGALGTDTGGSIRQPASFCGVVGVKPTYGRISRYGIIAYASSLDQAGPFASSVEDAALSLEIMCGEDELDMTTSSIEVPSFSANLSKDLRGMKVGLVKEYINRQVLSEETLKTLESAVQAVKDAGANVVEIQLPLTEHAVPVYYLVAASEASSNLARYDGVKYGYRSEFGNLANMDLEEFYSTTRGEGFGPEVKRRIMLGTYCLSSGYFDAYYKKACQVRRLLQNEFLEAFESCDVLLSPVTTSPAFKIGERISDPLSMYLNDIYTVSTNLVGIPGMSVPFGTSKENLPIGVQLQAGHFQEQKMLNVAFALESVSPVKGKVPNVY